MGDYPNRTDLRKPPARAKPIQNVTPHARPGTAPRPAAPPAGVPSPQPAVGPGDVPSLEDPTGLPKQPLTAGLSSGPGAGPSALNIVADENPELSILRHLYAQYPNPDLRRLISYVEAEA